MDEPEPIAIVGTACRFPGHSTSPSRLWELLKKPRDVQQEFPANRWNVDTFYHPDPLHHGTANVRHGYFLDDEVHDFDAQFFGISAVEAIPMDPQHRSLLETVYEGVESAGLRLEQLRGTHTGVYVGTMTADYGDLISGEIESMPNYFATGVARAMLANRVSYFFDWSGPSMSIDTACSSSLVAVHEAVQLLRFNTDATMAIAAGTNIMLHPFLFIGASNLSMLSPEGRSRMWDEKANGYARGEGVGVVILKRLSDAIRDGDNIQSIIRNTSVNQDGKTPGITMPSPEAQTRLIKTTYTKAGLDLSNPKHRPQYIEAHGTGTPTGDPLEAEALHTAFFRDVEGSFPPIHVGSIKSVIGHTEGAAGLAGILKANLALQHRTIPPNMHFEKLNPRMEPFYPCFRICDVAVPWPELDDGVLPRASVNCFGFGGTNAHAILEAYRDSSAEPEPEDPEMSLSSKSQFHTLNFSATSETSLREMLRRYADFLTSHPLLNVRELAWTLNARRSTFTVRSSVSGRTPMELTERLNTEASAKKYSIPGSVPDGEPRVLGIFTGQGAQWARMGAVLIETFPAIALIIDDLQQSLDKLSDRPSWSLRDELLAETEGSHVYEAEISQPLCTAIQVALISVLRAAGIRFDTVIGHSSGEIAAAFAAGWITESDAIRIAYYRGKHLSLAMGADGCKGAMMAAGLTLAEAKGLCNDPEFVDRINVAAFNSSSSVTLSGNSDAIDAARARLEKENKFARLLKVDKAYHSHHMVPVAKKYRQSLEECQIRVQSLKEATRWISTTKMQVMEHGDLDINYWVQNMVRPVYFHQSVDLASQISSFQLAIECGPHPVLKGPALQVIQESRNHTIPYTATLTRGMDDTEALGQCLGSIWQALGADVVDYASLTRFLSGPNARNPRLLDNLPSYPWNHDRALWHEPHVWARMRRDAQPPHELLGLKCADGIQQEFRWKNALCPQEMPWLCGHQVQGHPVFPAAAYICAAIEAAVIANKGTELNLITIVEFSIEQGMAFDTERSSIETQFTLTNIAVKEDVWSAKFAFYMLNPNDPLSLTRCASGTVSAVLGEGDEDALPESPVPDFGMSSIDTEQLYRWLETFNLTYSGVFRGLHSLHRKHGVVTGVINNPTQTDPRCKLLLHPATLDNAFQSLYLTNCYPGDGRFWALHVPVRIELVTINPQLCLKYAGREANLKFRSTSRGDRDCFDGDTDIFDDEGVKGLAQVEGLHIKPLAPPTAANDTALFYKTAWHVSEPSQTLAQKWMPDLTHETQFWVDRERVALHYLLQLDQAITPTEREVAQPHVKHLLACIDFIKSSLNTGTLLYALPEWLHDTADQVQAIVDSYPAGTTQNDDFIGLRMLGQRLPAVARGEHTMMEFMIENDLIDGFYARDIPFCAYSEALAKQMDQLAHRYPGINILEIGAGTGGTTEYVLKMLGKRFTEYTYTDISASFFERARDRFSEWGARMDYRTLDVTADPTAQGFKEQAYDCVICSLVLHATPDMDVTLKNVRRLLKPGGYLVMIELVERPEQVVLRSTVMVGSLPGWWLGHKNGRTLSPGMSKEQWEECLRRAGFSGGIDAYIPPTEEVAISYAVMTSQATNEYVDYLRAPIGAPGHGAASGEALTIVGGSTKATKAIVVDVLETMCALYENVRLVERMDDLVDGDFSVPFMGTVLFLSDLDTPVFKDLRAAALEGLKQIFQMTKTCLWVTLGAGAGEPYYSMSIGLCRTIREEMPHVRIQCLDFGTKEDLNAKLIATKLVQLEAIDAWTGSGVLLSNDLLWSIEQELLCRDGITSIPRLVQDIERNERYNSSRRRIVSLKHRAGAVIGIEKWPKGYEAYEMASKEQAQSHTRCIEIRVHCTTLDAVQVARGQYAYLVFGTRQDDNRPVFAVAFERLSVIQVPAPWVVPCGFTEAQAPQLLSIMRTYLAIASELLHHFTTKSTSSLVLLEPAEELSSLCSDLAVSLEIELVVLTSKKKVTGKHCVHVHSSAPKRVLQSHLPPNTGCLVVGYAERRFAEKVTACLPNSCEIRHWDEFQSDSANLDYDGELRDYATLASLLQSATGFSISQLREDASPPTVSASDLITQQKDVEKDNNIILKWGDTATVPLLAKSIDSQPLFDASKTYWLVGLTGGLGNSLSEWMVKNSARHLVLTSRNPSPDPQWLKHMENLGANITVMPCNVTNYDDVLETYIRILDHGRPIGGVAHGAMVLKDAPFVDVDVESTKKVIGPKVKGGINLDRLFSFPSTCQDLDFFIAFSSITAVIGNKGQAIYSSANCFLSGLIARRKKKGLVGSVINISSVLGAGYITRDGDALLREHLNQTGIRYMAESDFHQLFAEAVVSGKRRTVEVGGDCIEEGESEWEQDADWEITTGLQSVRLQDAPKATWVTTSRFSHCLQLADDDRDMSSTAHSSVSVKGLLAVATTVEEIRSAIADAFTFKIRAALLVDGTVPILDQTGQELSLDSLIGVDLRSWFMKEVKVDIAVMKILSGSRMSELVEMAVEKVPDALVPLVKRGQDTEV